MLVLPGMPEFVSHDAQCVGLGDSIAHIDEILVVVVKPVDLPPAQVRQVLGGNGFHLDRVLQVQLPSEGATEHVLGVVEQLGADLVVHPSTAAAVGHEATVAPAVATRTRQQVGGRTNAGRPGGRRRLERHLHGSLLSLSHQGDEQPECQGDAGHVETNSAKSGLMSSISATTGAVHQFQRRQERSTMSGGSDQQAGEFSENRGVPDARLTTGSKATCSVLGPPTA